MPAGCGVCPLDAVSFRRARNMDACPGFEVIEKAASARPFLSCGMRQDAVNGENILVDAKSCPNSVDLHFFHYLCAESS